MINIADVRVNGGTQSRAVLNLDVVADYADLVRAGVDFPAIVVFFDGKDYWLADGFHRYEAYSRAGAYEISADIRQGTQRDAILHSVGANAEHGLRRTNDDKRRAVMVLLNDPEWSAWSDREIARACGVGNQMVSHLRSSICVNHTDSANRTVTRNGTTYQQNTANIGAGSKPDQEPEPQQNNVVSLPSQPAKAEQSKPDQEPADPARKALAKLTPAALMDEVIGLQAENAELRATTKAQKLEIADLKTKLKEATADDLGASVGSLQRRLAQANFSRDEAMKTAKREEFKRTQAEKRVAELEGMGIAI